MERLIELFKRKVAATNLTFIRSLTDSIAWNARLVVLRGARGVGKTTLLLQHIKTTFGDDLSKVIYVSLDNLWFTEHSLPELADAFVKRGGKYLANQLSYSHNVAYSESGDFLIDGRYTIEVGGKNKTRKQIRHVPDAYIAADNLEYGYDRKIPLWLFGFLY